MSEETQLARIESKYPALTDLANFREAMADNIGPEGLSPADLERVKWPSGGSTAFEVPDITAEGGSTMEKTLEGVIIHHHLTRLYWGASYEETGGDEPPQCFSPDGRRGFGDPGGECATCQFSEWGSAASGDGQACNQRRQIYLLREGDYIPTVISMPPTSVRSSKKYLMGLVKKGIPVWSVISEIKLEKAKSDQGIEYAVAKIGLVEVLDDEARVKMKELVDQLKEVIKQAQQSRDFAANAA